MLSRRSYKIELAVTFTFEFHFPTPVHSNLFESYLSRLPSHSCNNSQIDHMTVVETFDLDGYWLHRKVLSRDRAKGYGGQQLHE